MIRHGLSEAQVNPEEYTRTLDSMVRLTEEGKIQAAEVRDELNWLLENSMTPESENMAMVSSPYERALGTAEIIQAGLNYSVQLYTSEWIKERELGSLIYEMDWCDILDNTQRDTNPLLSWNYRPEAGESYADVHSRAVEFYKDMKDSCHQHKVQRLIIVSHYVFLQALLMVIENKSPEDWSSMPHINNAVIVFRSIDI